MGALGLCPLAPVDIGEADTRSLHQKNQERPLAFPDFLWTINVASQPLQAGHVQNAVAVALLP